MAADEDRGERALARRSGTATRPWRGDDHVLEVEAAVEAGLPRGDVELDLYTRGFSSGMTIEDPLDGAIVARGRTVLKEKELGRSLRPALAYLGVGMDAVKIRVHDGSFELRVAKQTAESSTPALESGKDALKVFVGFGLLGFAAYQIIMPAVGGIIWGIALLLGGWLLRQGMASGRMMLAGRIALGLGMLAQEEKIILPPVDSPTEEQPSP